VLAGIDLPSLVGRGRPAVGRDGAATGGRGTQVGVDEGALQRPFAGEGPTGVPFAQDHPDQPGSPAGMLTPQPGGVRDQVRIGPPGLMAPAAVVAGSDGCRAAGAEAADQILHGLGAQSQVGGDVLGPVTPLRSVEDQLPLRYGHGASHLGPPC
jgi:hypothetical protein